jgi:metallo-beta-lactamase family protein
MTMPPQDMAEPLADIINQTIDRGGKVIVPSFAVGRTQEIAYYYNRLTKEGRIRRHVPFVVDSPLAVATTAVFRKHPETFDAEAAKFSRENHGMIFDCEHCRYITDLEDSKRLHDEPGPMIIVSASGMCEVGRILHHLKNNIEDPRNTVLIVGFQAANTLGRRIVERAKQVRIFGETYRVNATVKVLNGFSAHANAKELVDATTPLAPTTRKAFIVHGEIDQAQALAGNMRQHGFRDVVIPQPGDVFDLS